jgi:hypothetical protein
MEPLQAAWGLYSLKLESGQFINLLNANLFIMALPLADA